MRAAAFTGFSDTLSANHDARTLQVFGEAAYRIGYGKAVFEPFANFTYVDLRDEGFT